MIMDAIERLTMNVGLRALIARELGISRQAVCAWKRVPAERVLQVERITGIPRSDLRADLYPRKRRSS